ncbi:uncharacterized protein LOC142351713, partial [Convolutriloba macropyga]|uniref:uncharacterized protein LOC142351713 n=1 Tax=Convolutriloba macropyga TaxID=536237 RepID=UPI003F528F6A
QVRKVSYRWFPIDKFPFTLISREEEGIWGRYVHPTSASGRVSELQQTIRNTFQGYFDNPNLKSGQFRVVTDSRPYCPWSAGNVVLYNMSQMTQYLNSTVFQASAFPQVSFCKDSDLYWSMLADLNLVYHWVNKQPEFAPFPTSAERMFASASSKGSSSTFSSSFKKLFDPETIEASFFSTNSGVLGILQKRPDDPSLEMTWESLRRESNSLVEATRRYYNSSVGDKRIAFQMRVAYNYYKEADQRCFQSEDSYWKFDRNTYTFPLFMTAALFTTDPDTQRYNYGILGAVMEYKALLSWLESLFPECWNAEVAMEEPGLRCYILDEGAFIVANNRVKKDKRGTENNPYFMAANMQNAFIGANLHSLDYCLLQSLVRFGVYSSQQINNNICSCQASEIIPNKSSANRNLPTTDILALSIKILANFFIFGWTAVLSFVVNLSTNIGALTNFASSIVMFSTRIEGLPEFEPGSRMLCQLQTTKYIYTDRVQNVEASTNCSQFCPFSCDQGRKFRAHRIGQTNLLFVAVKGDPNCACGPKRTQIQQNFVLVENVVVGSGASSNKELKFNTCPLSSYARMFSQSSKDYSSGLKDLSCSANRNRREKRDTTCSFAARSSTALGFYLSVLLYAAILAF